MKLAIVLTQNLIDRLLPIPVADAVQTTDAVLSRGQQTWGELGLQSGSGCGN